jgi:ABC-type branched-subunit amino acid transport system substrate-binding protein
VRARLLRPTVPLVIVAWALAGVSACVSDETGQDVSIGLLLSYSGSLAADSINSERALRMAVGAANAAGGFGGRRFKIVAGDTRSNPARATPAARALVDQGASIFVGMDTTEIAVHLQSVLGDQTVILPSFATASGVTLRPDWWFIMGPSPERMACELAAQLSQHGRKRPLLVIAGGSGYSGQLAEDLTRVYGVPQVELPSNQPSTTMNLRPLLNASADAYVLAALPSAASSLVYGMAAIGAITDPARWYLSPTLHTPAFLENIPKGVLEGAHGVARGESAGAAEFRTAFRERWQDTPLDDAYTFYDAGAVAVLAVARALAREGAIAPGAGLARHVIAVTRAGARPVEWNQLARGLALLQQGEEIEYVGLSGPIHFDVSGQAGPGNTKWWTIGPTGFVDVERQGDCH